MTIFVVSLGFELWLRSDTKPDSKNTLSLVT